MRATTNVHIDLRSISAAAAVVDQDRISQLLTNLIANAIRACRSAVSVGVAEQGPNATIWIDDDGPGIALEDRERIFQRFVRLDAARDQESGGSGLGLAICRDIVAAHNGSIAVEESPIGGARFVVRLPLRKG